MPCRPLIAHRHSADAWLIMRLPICVTQPSLSRLGHARSDAHPYTNALILCHSMSDYQLYCVPGSQQARQGSPRGLTTMEKEVQHQRSCTKVVQAQSCLTPCCGAPAFARHLLQPPPHVINQHVAYTALQAVRAAAEARQPPSDSAPDLLHQKASTKPMGPKKPPAVLKPPKAKPVFVRKRSSTDAAAVQTTVSPPFLWLIVAISAHIALHLRHRLLGIWQCHVRHPHALAAGHDIIMHFYIGV